MKFNWDGFNKESFDVACAIIKENDGYENFIGAVRVGDLCFDILTREYNNKLYLDYDLYIGGVDTGYGYADDYPYDYYGGGSFDESCIDMKYDEFVSYAEKTMKEFIENEESAYTHASLIEKANDELNMW